MSKESHITIIDPENLISPRVARKRQEKEGIRREKTARRIGSRVSNAITDHNQGIIPVKGGIFGVHTTSHDTETYTEVEKFLNKMGNDIEIEVYRDEDDAYRGFNDPATDTIVVTSVNGRGIPVQERQQGFPHFPLDPRINQTMERFYPPEPTRTSQSIN